MNNNKQISKQQCLNLLNKFDKFADTFSNYVYRLLGLVAIFTCIICLPIIATESVHITCDKQGNCNFKKSILLKETKQTTFILATNSDITCKQIEQNYNLVIDTNKQQAIPEIIPLARCERYKQILKNAVKDEDKTIKYRHLVNSETTIAKILFIILGVIGTIFGIILVKNPQIINKLYGFK